jgi:hypothetical protein
MELKSWFDPPEDDELEPPLLVLPPQAAIVSDAIVKKSAKYFRITPSLHYRAHGTAFATHD